MQDTLHFNFQFCLSKHLPRQNPVCNVGIAYYRSHYLSAKPSLCHSLHLHSLSNQTQIRSIVVCARKRKRGSGYKKLRTILPQLLSFLASNTKILPEPLSLAIAEFGGESGGGFGFLKGLHLVSFDGRRRKGISFGFYGVLVINSLLLLLLLFGREFRSEVLVVGVLALGSFGVLFARKYKRRVKELVLGVCFVVALVGLGLRREEIQKCAQRLIVSSSVLKLVRKSRRSGRRLF